MADFFAMGGYAAYVWPCYVLSLLVVVLNVWWPQRRRKRLLQQLQREARRAELQRKQPTA